MKQFEDGTADAGGKGGKDNIHRYLKNKLNNQKGARGLNRFGCAARLSQQLRLIMRAKI
jgi:hypothetical protein